MKKLLVSVFSFVLTTTALYAQNDVTKFLGIPVDGTKEEMIQKLKAKGFRSSSYDREVLEGEFNGRDVQIHIVTNNNKVYRIMIRDANTVGEQDIKIRFNTLCQQFNNNEKYMSFNDYTISDDEDIRYEIHKKRYEASFFQRPEDPDAIADGIRAQLLLKYSEEELENPTEEIRSAILASSYNLMTKKSVWFLIADSYGKYCIVMYYDNEYNAAQGEDL